MAIKITLMTDGPITLSAEGEDFPVLKTEGGQDIKLEKDVYLCRCGASQT